MKGRIRLKTQEDILKIKEGGQIIRKIFTYLGTFIKVGQTTLEIDKKIGELIKQYSKNKARSAFKGYKPDFSPVPFPANSCLSINDELTHGVPSKKTILREGDLINVDLGLIYKGRYSDSGITLCVGKCSTEKKNLLKATKEALRKAITVSRLGKRLGDIGWEIESVARKYGYNIARGIGGHGVGYAPHEDPYIPNYGDPGTGMKLIPGMVIALEPFLVEGDGSIVETEGGGFPVIKSEDGSLSAQFEHTIAITKKDPMILT